MTAAALAPAHTTMTADDDVVTHVYCCDPDIALCGKDISNQPEVEEDGILCVVCEDLEEQPCTCGTRTVP